jgi:hypothetical protein
MAADYGFKRLWRAPQRMWRGQDFGPLSARASYLRAQSQARFARRPDAYLPSMEPLTGEIGRIESFRFITSSAAPAPPPLTPATLRALDAKLRQRGTWPRGGSWLLPAPGLRPFRKR